MMLLSQHMGPLSSGRVAGDISHLGCHPQYNSSRPVARQASLKVSAFESQAQPWKKSPASSSRYMPNPCYYYAGILRQRVLRAWLVVEGATYPDHHSQYLVGTDVLTTPC